MIHVLKYPYPFKAWLSISNDPDNTDLETWRELDQLIFKELQLDWANVVFLFSHNKNLPNQVNVSDHPEIANQPIDGIHTWGDFVHAGAKGFSREDAQAGLALLRKYRMQPLIWVDHSRFAGNFIHNKGWGAKPTHTDQSGVTYTVYEYSLDLATAAGVRYIWDGELASFIGQDRKVRLRDWLQPYSLTGKIRYIWNHLLPIVTGRLIPPDGNVLLTKKQFPDGQQLYLFKRYGFWKEADIVGLAKVIAPANIDELLQKEGAMIAYTHLGKKRPNFNENKHVPEATRACLQYIKKKSIEKQLLFSPVSKLLDYVVLRNHLEVSKEDIVFRPDGIRFNTLTATDLKGFTFSFSGVQPQTKVWIDDTPFAAAWDQHENDIYSLSF